jgi:thiol-disulfide isomerase/thioredoxin
MKIKYLTILAAVSLFTLGTISACSKPSATTSANNVETESKVNPCAAKANPCAGKKVNPCAAKGISASIGGPLAKSLQGKPVVVDVYASWCPACKNIAPTVAQLKQKYAGKVEFVVLDVSDKSTTAAAEAKATELGLSKFLAANKTQTGSLTIVDPGTGNILAQHRNNPEINDYSKVLDAAITK